MLERLEQLLAEAAIRKAIGEQLRGRIVRAQRWNQLFATPEEAEATFLVQCVLKSQEFYRQTHGFGGYTVEPNPDGYIHMITSKKQGLATSYQRRVSGNVVVTLYEPDQPPVTHLITPSVGNTDHPFTISNTTTPNPTIVSDSDFQRNARIAGRVDSKTLDRVFSLVMYPVFMNGDLAIPESEEIMLTRGDMPQRIGYRIFCHSALAAQAEFAQAYPNLMPKPDQP